MPAIPSLMFVAFFVLGSLIFTTLWQMAVTLDADRRTRTLNLFGATTVCLSAGLVLALTTRDHLFAPFMIVAGIAYMMGWALNVDAFAPKSAHPHGNEQFMEEYDAPAPHLTIV